MDIPAFERITGPLTLAGVVAVLNEMAGMVLRELVLRTENLPAITALEWKLYLSAAYTTIAHTIYNLILTIKYYDLIQNC